MNFTRALRNSLCWRNTKYVVIALCAALVISACKKNGDFYQEADPSDQTFRVQVSDTATMLLVTERFTHTASHNLPYDFLGTVNDKVFGRTTASLYSQLYMSSPAPSFSGEKADSLVLTLARRAGPNQGDFNTPQTFRIYQLKNTLLRDVAYADTIVPKDSLLATYTGRFSPGDTVIRIRLNEVLSRQLMAAPGGTFSTQSDFNNYLKGIAIIADSTGFTPGSGALIPFRFDSVKTNLILYYGGGKRYNMNFYDPSISETESSRLAWRVAKYSHDFTGTPVEKAMKDTSGYYPRAYIEGPTGLRVKIKLPYFRNYLGAAGETLALLKAEFSFPKLDSAADPLNKNAPSLLVFRPRMGDGEDNTGFSENLYGYYGGSFSSTTNEYRFNLTRFLQTALQNYRNNALYQPQGLTFNLSPRLYYPLEPFRAILMSRSSANFQKPKLTLTFTKLKDK